MKGRVALLTAVAAAMLQAGTAAADAFTYPNGPYTTNSQTVMISSLRTYDELVATLENITDSSQGASQLAYLFFPAKGSGRSIPYVKIGNGPKAMTVIAQQHGDEWITSNGMIALIRHLSANSKEAKFVRDNVSLYVVPRVNIDGFDATPSGVPQRYNVDPFCTTSPCPPYYGRGVGYDINRYHSVWADHPFDNPNVPSGGTQTPTFGTPNPVPESKNVRWLFDLAGGPSKVKVSIDLHGQGTPVTEDRDMVTVSTLWPTAASAADYLGVKTQFDAAQLRAKKVIAVAMKAWSEIAHAQPSLYDGGPEPGIARNAYGLLGSASVLMEHRGTGQKAGGYMENISFNAVLAVVKALADGSLENANPTVAESLQPDVGSASLFWKCVVARPYTLDNYNFCREKIQNRPPVTTLPPFPWPDAAPGPGEAVNAEAAAQIMYELTTE